MKLWAFFFVLWLALCGLGYAWLHPDVTLPGTEYSVNYFLGQNQPQGILPGDLPGEIAPVTESIQPESSETH
ncbi:MAG: hypothetical protein ACLGG0_09595 [Bacteriovoracia bacterium]